MQIQLPPTTPPPPEFGDRLQQLYPHLDGRYLAALLWQRQLCTVEEISSYLQAHHYQPTSALAFGEEMELALELLIKARDQGWPIAIWGDFDADGITATSVLWDGLRQFFDHVIYTIPDRLKESHGLNLAGIDRLHDQGIKLIITCDTGSTNSAEVTYAASLGIQTIVTDHHTLPPTRPPVAAIINPRALPSDHPFYHLSGVAVAYKLVEALYLRLPTVPQQPLEYLLDLVAIGLVADLVQLQGECRYLAQVGIQRLQQQKIDRADLPGHRPGVAKLLELCRRRGDRPMDISFGIAPRINAISRIHGEASFGVELLTSRHLERCEELAWQTEQANIRRKELQKNVTTAVSQRVAALDLSTTGIIVLADGDWAPGVLGLVAGQIAQTYGRPTILLGLATDLATGQTIARGSARSIQGIDLYQLVASQRHLLNSFGGHPFAAGLSIWADRLNMFAEGLDRQLYRAVGQLPPPQIAVDLIVTVAELGQPLAEELRLLEPCGMGNPVPKLLVRGCHLRGGRNANIKDLQGRQVRYLKTDAVLTDDSTDRTFPVVWWGHGVEELPTGSCDVVVEVDFNCYKKCYEARLLHWCPIVGEAAAGEPPAILDFRRGVSIAELPLLEEVCWVRQVPRSWDELLVVYAQARSRGQKLALAYRSPPPRPPETVLQTLLGGAKFLARTGQPVARGLWQEKLGISAGALREGWDCLEAIGFEVTVFPSRGEVAVTGTPSGAGDLMALPEVRVFLERVAEELFVEQYFGQVDPGVIITLGQQ